MFSSRKMFFVPLALALLVSALGCSSGSEQSQQTMESTGQKAEGMLPSDAGGGDLFVGTVGETFDAADYTYVRLEKGDESVWAAGPRTEVEAGEEIGVSLQMPMQDFRSEALDRTFETLYFVGNFERNDGHAHDSASGSNNPHGGMDMSGTDPDAEARTAPPSTELSLEGITKPAGGHAIAEVWSEKASLAGTTVAVRGRVVKYNSGIMGRNWLHIQDGSGTPASKDHDMTVTTEASAKVGDIVTVRGVLATDKDFGAGYSYAAIIEDAKLEVEAGGAH